MPAAWAQIATDRPAVTDSSAVVPNGTFQAENGVLYTDNQGHVTWDFPETLIRVGIGPSTEVRFTAPDYYYDSVTPAGLRLGFGDVAAGIKQQLRTASGGFEVAAVVSLSFPTGSAAISSHGYDPSFQLPWSRPLSANWTVAGMLSVYVPTVNGSRTVIGESTILVDRQLTSLGTHLSNTPAIFRKPGGRATFCTSGRLIRFGRASNSTCMWESGFRRRPWIILLGWGTRFGLG